MNIIKMYDKAVDEKVFFIGVKEYLLDKNLTGAFNADTADEILDAFMEYLDENYPSGEVFYYTEEDKVQRVEEFCDEIFSYLGEDYEALEIVG